MMNLYFLMTFLFLAVAGLTALDAALTSWTIIPWVNGLRWLRVHFITLGALTEMLFGLLPLLAAKRASLPKPRTRLDIWLLLNAGLMLLLAGIPIVNRALIFTGGTLIFVATTLLMHQLYQLRPVSRTEPGLGRKFYLMGLSFFLVGIIVGTGLWLGWSELLLIQTPVEVHIHANNWGLMSLVFAGLLVDLYPKVAKRPFAWPNSPNKIFWLMSLGALGLVLGPWFNSLYFTVPGLILHLTATIWLLLNVIKPVWGDKAQWAKPGLWHLTTAYFWLIAPLLVAPLIILQVPGFPGTTIEQNAPQALIYGWLLQFGFAIIPYFARRQFQSQAEAELGGSWISLTMVHLGGVALWVSIFVTNAGFWHGLAYILWTLSILPIAWQLWQIIRPVLEGERPDTAVASSD
jgi:cytochrome c oxidase cbb3-type subunit I